jgi:hypothetical protein
MQDFDEDGKPPDEGPAQGSFWSLDHLNSLFDGSTLKHLLGLDEEEPTGPPAVAEDTVETTPEPPQRAGFETRHGRPVVNPFRATHPGYMPHDSEPVAVLPDGTAVPPDSYGGGFHGARTSPEQVLKEKGFRQETLFEDWRLLEHVMSESSPHSAFRGATPFVSAPPDSPHMGAAEWADEGGWVYDIFGVPTWDVNSSLEGRVPVAGMYRGNLMYGEVEQAIPSQIPLECIKRWGQVSDWGGRNIVREWTPNPQYNDALCRRFFEGLGASQR